MWKGRTVKGVIKVAPSKKYCGTCPWCGSTLVGRLTQNRFFCQDCFSEIAIEEEWVRVYNIGPDGGLRCQRQYASREGKKSTRRSKAV